MIGRSVTGPSKNFATMLESFALGLALLAFVAVGHGTAQAGPITLGQTVAGPSGTTFQGGTLLASLSTEVATDTFSGTARSAVYRNSAGLLDFYYQFTNSGPDDIGRLSFFNFDGFITEVYFVIDGAAIGAGFLTGTVESEQADRGADPAFNSIGFDYQADTFFAGTTSFANLIRTNAVIFQAGTFSVSDGSTSTTPSFAPALAAVPEPASLLLLGTGLAGVVAAVRKRRKSA